MERRYFDNHTHSYFSADSRMSIDDAVKVAYERGLSGICLTDHLDFDAPPGVTEFTFEVPAQQEAIDAEVHEPAESGSGGVPAGTLPGAGAGPGSRISGL